MSTADPAAHPHPDVPGKGARGSVTRVVLVADREDLAHSRLSDAIALATEHHVRLMLVAMYPRVPGFASLGTCPKRLGDELRSDAEAWANRVCDTVPSTTPVTVMVRQEGRRRVSDELSAERGDAVLLALRRRGGRRRRRPAQSL